MKSILALPLALGALLAAGQAFANDRGDRIENRLDRKGDHADNRLDRRGERFDRRWDRRH